MDNWSVNHSEKSSFRIYQNGSKDGRYCIAEDTHEQNLRYSELYHYGVKGMRWGVRKDLAKARLSKNFNEVRYSKPVRTAVNTKVGKVAKKSLYTTFDVKNFDDLVVKVGKMTKSPKGIAAIAAIAVLPDPFIWAGMAAYASVKNSGVLNRRLKHEDVSMNELKHYGILGMKWGVRRYQPYPTGKHGTFLGQSRDEDIHIKKGTKAYRLQKGKELAKTGQMYVSFDELDHFMYVESTSAGGAGLGIDLSDGKGESIRMVLDRDIIAPSYKATMDAFIKTISDMNGPKNFAKDVIGEQNTKMLKDQKVKDLIKALRRRNVNDALDEAYLTFSGSLMKDTKARRMFFDNLKAEGYNAIVDENDKRFGKGYTEAPVILFDASSVRKKSSRNISDKDIEYFSDIYWGGMRDSKKAGFNASEKYWEDFAQSSKDARRRLAAYDYLEKLKNLGY